MAKVIAGVLAGILFFSCTSEENSTIPPRQIDWTKIESILQQSENSTAPFRSSLSQLHSILAYEIIGEKVDAKRIEQLLIELEKRLQNDGISGSVSEKINRLNRFVYDSLKMEPVFRKGYPEDYLLPSILERKQAACMGFSGIFLTLAESQNLDLHPVFLPGHVFLRLENTDTIVNIETLRYGLNRNDEFYQGFFQLEKRKWHDLHKRSRTQFLAGLVYNFGNALREQGYINQAKTAFIICEKYLPGFPEALGNLAILQMETGKTDSAKILFAKVLRGDSLSIPVLENLAEMARMEKNWGKAASIFKKLTKHYPDNPQYRNKWKQSLEKL